MSVIFVFCDRRIRDKDLSRIFSENRESTFPTCSFSMAFMFLNETSPSNWPLRKSSDRKSPFRWVSILKSANESEGCVECKLPNLICESSFTGTVPKSCFKLCKVSKVSCDEAEKSMRPQLPKAESFLKLASISRVEIFTPCSAL